MPRHLLLPLTTLVLASCGSTCLVGCGSEPARTMEEPMKGPQPAVSVDPAHTVAIAQGAQGRVGPCSVGVVATDSEAVTVLASHNRAGIRLPLGKGDLLACGGLYRVVAIGDIRAINSSTLPGIAFDTRPVSVPGVTLAAHGWVLPLGGRAIVTPFEFSDITLAGGRARFHVKETATRADGSVATAERDADAGVGDTVALLDKRHAVIAIVPPDPALGIRGWVELSSTPLP